MSDTRGEYLKSINTFLQREDDFLLYTSDDSLEDDCAEEEDDVAEPRLSRKLLAGISVLVGMALGMGILVGSVVVKLYLDDASARASMPVTASAEEPSPGWMTAREILFEPKITEGDCSVLCGKTVDDLIVTLGKGCGARQIALCQELWEVTNADE